MTMTLIELFRLHSSGIIQQYNHMVFRQGKKEIGRTDTGVIMFFERMNPVRLTPPPFTKSIL